METDPKAGNLKQLIVRIVSDKTFELSLTALSVLAVLWMILASIFVFDAVWAIIIGLVVWLIGGGILLYYWGRSYMSRL